MTSEEKIRELYIQDMEDYCNILFDREDLPAGVEIALMKCMSFDPKKYGVASEKLFDMSKTYKSSDELVNEIRSNINKYARPHLVGDKSKRPYVSGRD